MPTRLEHANITVPDVDAAIAFLSLVDPDFRVLHDDHGPPRWTHFGTEQGYFALEEPHRDAPDATRARPYHDYGVNHLGLVVDDIEAVTNRLTSAGFPETHIRETHRARLRRYFHDAAGFEWEIVQYLSDDPSERFRYD